MTVWIGGDLPESALPELIETIQEDINNDILRLIDGWGVEQDSVENMIKGFKEPNSIEFGYEIDYGPDDCLDIGTSLEDFCEAHNLTVKKRIPPCVSDGKHYNEAYYVRAQGKTEVIATDGEGEIALNQTATLNLFDKCWALSQLSLEEIPLLINDKDEETRLYAKATLLNKPFNEIFKELLLQRVGHEEVGCPPFKIITGR